MTTDGGGWTLVMTKLSPSMIAWAGAFAPACAATTSADCASAVHPDLDYREVLWRFADTDAYRARWYADADASFRSFLGGADLSVSGTPVAGFTKTVAGVFSGPHTIAVWHYLSTHGVSENHDQSDAWVDLWRLVDSSNNYAEVENGTASLVGTKCLAGYCRAAPVWMLVR